MASSPVWFSIPEFLGIRQDKDSRLLPFGTAYYAQNIDTSDGSLTVAKGYTKYISAAIPDEGISNNKPRSLVVAHTSSGTDKIYVVSGKRIYLWDKSVTPNVWRALDITGTSTPFEFTNSLFAVYQIDKLQMNIGTANVVLVCTGKNRIYKIIVEDPSNTSTENTVSVFGDGRYSYEGTVSSYYGPTRLVTLNTAMTSEAMRRCLAYGITIAGSYYKVDSVQNSTTVKLASEPTSEPYPGDAVKVQGGVSDAKAAYVERYANRLFAAGDPSAPCRLYWSCVPGDGRTYEDWAMVDGSEDASGGYVEVNAEDGDPIIGITALSNQLLIFKRHSVWRLYGDRPSTFTLERVEKNSDMMSNRGVIVRHDVPYFLMPDGVYTYDGVGIVPLDGGVSHLDRFFKNGIEGNEGAPPRIEYSTCAFWNNRLYFSYRIGDSTQREETGIVVYDAARGTYMLRTGMTFVDLAITGSDILLLDTAYVHKFENGTTYNGSPIWARWRTQWTDFGKKMNVHQVMAMYLQLLSDDVDIAVAGDYTGASQTQTVKMTTERAGYTVARFQTDQSHYFRFSFLNQIQGTTRATAFSIPGGVNIKALSELKE